MKVTGINWEFQINFVYKIIQTHHLSETNISFQCFLTTYEPKFKFVIISSNRLYGRHKHPFNNRLLQYTFSHLMNQTRCMVKMPTRTVLTVLQCNISKLIIKYKLHLLGPVNPFPSFPNFLIFISSTSSSASRILNLLRSQDILPFRNLLKMRTQ